MTTLPAGVGVATDVGLRAHMEDRWAVQATPGGLFAAVYDGHGGTRVADQAAALLHLAVLRALQAGLDAGAALGRAFAELDRRRPTRSAARRRPPFGWPAPR